MSDFKYILSDHESFIVAQLRDWLLNRAQNGTLPASAVDMWEELEKLAFDVDYMDAAIFEGDEDIFRKIMALAYYLNALQWTDESTESYAYNGYDYFMTVLAYITEL